MKEKMWHSRPRLFMIDGGDCFCSATPMALKWIFLKLKWLAGRTSPLPGGSERYNFRNFRIGLARPPCRLSYICPNKCVKIARNCS